MVLTKVVLPTLLRPIMRMSIAHHQSASFASGGESRVMGISRPTYSRFSATAATELAPETGAGRLRISRQDLSSRPAVG